MRALLSVSDKTGVVELARELAALNVDLISTGGTAAALRAAGLKVTEVSEITGFPECLDGRVKTLHPKVHAGILAMRSNVEHMKQLKELGVDPIDMVVINLYPFKQTIQKEGVTLEEAIENIDIGGPTMIRAAAKNWQDVTVMVDPADYAGVLEELKANGAVSRETKFRLAYKVFEHTANYDAMITNYLRPKAGIGFPEKLTVTFEKVQEMRYGENPHQKAVFYREPGAHPGTLVEAQQLQGKELSYNNISDTNGALEVLREFSETTVVGVKHANPCGVATAPTVLEAWQRAYAADPVSIFGGIVVTNAPIDEQTALSMKKIFLEVIVAPAYTPEALAVFAKKKNLRVLVLPSINAPLPKDTWDMKKVGGGLLVQDQNLELIDLDSVKVVTQRHPTEKEMKDMIFAWKIVKHTKSNGIAVAKDDVSLGIGPGQVNRIWAAQQAIERSGEAVKGAAMASDAYFPFDDCVKAAADAGITCIVQPGGSINDADSIKAADEAGIAMIFTGIRHFKHS
ncbi:MAG: bifunctional phosphoribosylaminoimidazolecarboxamide formyltransferase/IMP cyclohydrolase [Eubacteriales bacterium]|nr:bifunctional phosphoribosylaminoimidazolecarboxamide formyltransferase/IMP cyclohydrolase [Eubacteriales bacterium]